MKLQIIISDYTYMTDSYCIAGWSVAERKMLRLLINGKHWEEKDTKLVQGHSCIQIETIPIEREKQRDYPHKSEDTWITDNIKILYQFNSPKELAYELEPSLSKTIKNIFNGHLKENNYVLPKTKCPSLGAIKVSAGNISFYKDSEDKLRIKIIDNDNEKYDLRVTCRYLRDVLDQEKGLEKLNEDLKKMSFAHIRVGLAKPYYLKNNHCYLMCNGVFLY